MHGEVSIKKIKKTFTLQKDQSDCGVACLQNIIRYHGGDVSLERLRELSGADKQGTTLLGLFQCASQMGFQAQGAQAEGLENLKEVKQPCILHLTIENKLMHYVVYYPITPEPSPEREENFIIGDPAKGIVSYSSEQLVQEWQSKSCLLLIPTKSLQQKKITQKNKWEWFKNVLKEDVELLWLAAFLGATMAVLNLSTALFSQQLIDKILPKSDYTTLVLGTILLTILLIAKSGIGYVRQFLLIKQAYQFNVRLTGSFYKSLLYLKKAFFDNRKTGDLIARLDDTLRIQRATSYMLGDISIQILLLLASLGFIFAYSWKLGLAGLIIIPVIFLVVKKYEKEILEQQRNTMIGHAQYESNYVDTIKGIGTIKALNKEWLFEKTGIKIFSGFQDTLFRLGKTIMGFNLASEITAVIFLTGIILWSSLMVLHHSLTIGAMMAVLQMATIIMHSATSIALTNIQLQEAKVAFDRMYEFSSLEPEYRVIPKEDKMAVPDDFSFENLIADHISFRFPGRKPLMQDVSFVVNKHELVTIVGESGQGKSTLLQILQKMYSPEDGSIKVNGKDLKEWDVLMWRKNIGIVSQDITLFSGSLLANILLEEGASHAENVIDFCCQSGFHRFFKDFPQQYFTLVGEGGINLSGGQKQLVALARCLYHDPQLLLLDEPTSAMDKLTEKFVLDLLIKIKREKTILVISHRDSLTSISDRIYALQQGTIQAVASHCNSLS